MALYRLSSLLRGNSDKLRDDDHKHSLKRELSYCTNESRTNSGILEMSAA